VNTTGDPVPLGCGFMGTCDPPTGTCICVGGFHGIVCQFPPGVDECVTVADCQDSNPCTIDVCDNKTCIYTAVDCNDNNLCTNDFCNASGCQNLEDVVCNDDDGCTDDRCDPLDGLCYHDDRSGNCSNLTDICNDAYCDPLAAKDNQCFQQPIVCPRDNNCTIAFCEMNATTNVYGCTNTTLDCGSFLSIALGAGLGAGVLAAIILAALLAACGTAGAGTYAVSKSVSDNDSSEVINNPLYCGTEHPQANPLCKD
jgi:hypothetical protein